MKKNKTYVFHSDPGHGWLAVKRSELLELELADKISTCSYQNGKTVYLEEDCDASLFINALKERDIEFKCRESFKEYTPIRNYERFST